MAIGLAAIERCYCNKSDCWKPESDFSLVAREQHRRGDENAMCLECVEKAWRSRIGRSEVTDFIREDRERMLKRTRNPEFEEMVGEARIGKRMHSTELIRRLAKLIPNFVPWPGNIEGQTSLYRIFGDRVDFICWTSDGILQEFSSVEFNKWMQPIKEIRGWRTVVLRVIKFGLLTEEQARKEFGEPSNPSAAKFWNRQLYNLRNNRTVAKD